MDERENALRIIRFDSPERVATRPPLYEICYHGANHEGFEGGSDDSPVGSRWFDVWGTGWHKVHAGVMGLPEVTPLARIDSLGNTIGPTRTMSVSVKRSIIWRTCFPVEISSWRGVTGTRCGKRPT